MLCLVVVASVFGVYDHVIPDEISFYAGESIPSYFGADAALSSGIACFADGDSGAIYEGQADYKLLGCIPVKRVNLTAYGETMLYPGGMPFGVKFYTDGVLVVGFCDIDTPSGKVNPAYDAGLRQKDIITHIDGRELSGASELTKAV